MTSCAERPASWILPSTKTETKLESELLLLLSRDTILSTTIDADIQRLAEKILQKRAKRGAIVVIDPGTGEIFALASWPTINPNDFVPSISEEKLRKIENDPNIPMLPRAYRSAYPPGSTFKVIVGVAGFESHAITPTEEFDCTSALEIGNMVFRNWKKSDAGELNFRQALEQSCNTWFYQAGQKIGARVVGKLGEAPGIRGTHGGSAERRSRRPDSDGRIHATDVSSPHSWR